jgi:hypothetical protein
MEYLNRISQPSPLMDFSRHGRHGDESLERYGAQTRNRPRDAGASDEGRSFAHILDRLIQD